MVYHLRHIVFVSILQNQCHNRKNNLNLYMSIIYQVIAFSLHSLVVKRKSLSFTCRFAKKHMSWYCVCFLECDMSFLDSKVLSIHTNETRYIFVLPILRPFSTESNSAKYTTLYQGFLSLNQTSVWGYMSRI